MKNSKPDSGYLKKIRKKTIDLLKKAPKKFEDEDYHKLRVEIKKLKSIAGFISEFMLWPLLAGCLPMLPKSTKL